MKRYDVVAAAAQVADAGQPEEIIDTLGGAERRPSCFGPITFQVAERSMNDEKLSVLVRRFAVAAQAHQAALEDMDVDRANAHSRVISGLHAAIISEGTAGREALLALLDSESQVVAGMAAVFSLRYNPTRSLEVLRVLATREGLLGFRASVALERWESGEWDEP